MLSMFHTVSHGLCHQILPNDIQVQNDIFRRWTLDPARLNVTLIFIQTSQSQRTHVTFLLSSLF